MSRLIATLQRKNGTSLTTATSQSSDTVKHEWVLTHSPSNAKSNELFQKSMGPSESKKQLGGKDSNEARCSQQPETHKKVRFIALQHQPSNRQQKSKRRSIVRVLARRRNADIEEVHLLGGLVDLLDDGAK